jgi:predicted metal-dependent hydrolase
MRAKHYSLRVRDGQLIATMPKRGAERELISFINSRRERLLDMLAKSLKRPVLNESCQIKTCTFELHIFRTQRTNIYISLKDEKLHIACPEETDFTDEQMQQKLWDILTKVIRYEAARVLPARVNILAELHGFNYKGVTVRKSGTRWGSCSSKKQLNLSLSLMFLPEYLIDYVLLHELCHTVEMNHSERFWALMDQTTNGNTQKYRKELKAYQLFF